jgi:hypothetical protein
MKIHPHLPVGQAPAYSAPPASPRTISLSVMQPQGDVLFAGTRRKSALPMTAWLLSALVGMGVAAPKPANAQFEGVKKVVAAFMAPTPLPDLPETPFAAKPGELPLAGDPIKTVKTRNSWNSYTLTEKDGANYRALIQLKTLVDDPAAAPTPQDLVKALDKVDHGQLETLSHGQGMDFLGKDTMSVYVEAMSNTVRAAQKSPESPQRKAVMDEVESRLKTLTLTQEHQWSDECKATRVQAVNLLLSINPQAFADADLGQMLLEKTMDRNGVVIEIIDPEMKRSARWISTQLEEARKIPLDQFDKPVLNVDGKPQTPQDVLGAAQSFLEGFYHGDGKFDFGIDQEIQPVIHRWAEAVATTPAKDLNWIQATMAVLKFAEPENFATRYMVKAEAPTLIAGMTKQLDALAAHYRSGPMPVAEQDANRAELWKLYRDVAKDLHTDVSGPLKPVLPKLQETMVTDFTTQVKTDADVRRYLATANTYVEGVPQAVIDASAPILEKSLDMKAPAETRQLLYRTMGRVPLVLPAETSTVDPETQVETWHLPQRDNVDALFMKAFLAENPDDGETMKVLVQQLMRRHLYTRLSLRKGNADDIDTQFDRFKLNPQEPAISLVEILAAPERLVLDPTKPVTRELLLDTLDAAFPSARFKADPVVSKADSETLLKMTTALARKSQLAGVQYASLFFGGIGHTPSPDGKYHFINVAKNIAFIHNLGRLLEIADNDPVLSTDWNGTPTPERTNLYAQASGVAESVFWNLRLQGTGIASFAWVSPPPRKPIGDVTGDGIALTPGDVLMLDTLKAMEHLEYAGVVKPERRAIGNALDQRLVYQQVQLMAPLMASKPSLESLMDAGYWHQVPAEEVVGPVMTRDEFTEALGKQGWTPNDMPTALKALGIDNVNPPPIRNDLEGGKYDKRRDAVIKTLVADNVTPENMRLQLKRLGMEFPYDPAVVTHRVTLNFPTVFRDAMKYSKEMLEALSHADTKTKNREIKRVVSRYEALTQLFPDLRVDMEDPPSIERFKKAFPIVHRLKALEESDLKQRQHLMAAYLTDIDMILAGRIISRKPGQPTLEQAFVPAIPTHFQRRWKKIEPSYPSLGALQLNSDALMTRLKEEAEARLKLQRQTAEVPVAPKL